MRCSAIAGAMLTIVVVSGQTPAIPQFVDIARQAGIDFRHVNGASPDKHLVETMGSGGLFFDFDVDGWIDVFLVDGGSLADPAVDRRARHRLYRNRADGTFADATERSGIRRGPSASLPSTALPSTPLGARGAGGTGAYGMGACAADYD